MKRPDVPHSVVVELARLTREKEELERKAKATMAEMIRGCIAAIQQTTDQAKRRLERERMHLKHPKCVVRMHEPQQKVNEDKRLTLLHLEWLATSLENQSVRQPDTIDQEKTSCSPE